MEITDRFKEAMNNVYLFNDKEPESVGYTKNVLVEEVEHLAQQILKENENRISDYDINNFEKDFNNLMQSFIDILEDPNYKLSTKRSNSIYLFKGTDICVDIYSIKENEYFLIPSIPYSWQNNKEIEECFVLSSIHILENSFADLLRKELIACGFSAITNTSNRFENFKCVALNPPKLILIYDLEKNLKNSLVMQINSK